jgi:hypothetical protein
MSSGVIECIKWIWFKKIWTSLGKDLASFILEY